MDEKDLVLHWNSVYENSPIKELGWYEEDPEPSLGLIKKYVKGKDDVILNVGAGAGTLIDRIVEEGFTEIIANDLSSSALEKLKERLGHNQSKVRWIVDDLTNPNELLKLDPIDLWHDRAVLHFFNEAEERNTYFKLIKRLINTGGKVIIAAFNLDGAPMCSGLPVFRYDANMLQIGLGNEFKLRESFNHTYTMPDGNKREYVYAVFEKTE